MASVNRVILVGNLGRDPELRYIQSGQAVANFTLATNDRWRDKEGNNQERTEWHRIVVWGKSAENCAQYLQKGRSVYVEGRLQTREWEDKEGNKRQTTEVVAQAVQFLGGRGGAGGWRRCRCRWCRRRIGRWTQWRFRFVWRGFRWRRIVRAASERRSVLGAANAGPSRGAPRCAKRIRDIRQLDRSVRFGFRPWSGAAG